MCGSPRRVRWNATPSPPTGSTRCPIGRSRWVGHGTRCGSSTPIWAAAARARPGRSGFAELTTLVGLGQVGIVLALEVSRLARNNSDWYRLLDLAGMTNTLLADADGVYHPGLFNDRMLLGLKGTMSEAELHVLRARLDGGIRNKAKRGELRRGLPVGLVWGEDEGQILLHPDEAVTGVIAAVFARFAACGSVRGTWLWLREQKLKWPLQPAAGATSPAPQVIWVEPTYHAVHTTLTHPAYAGAYVYGRTRAEKYVTPDGDLRTRRRRIGRDEWEVFIPEHHQGFLDWDDFLANQQRIGGISARSRTSPAPAPSGRAARCCRAWPPAGPAAASSPSTTTGGTTTPPATTAPAPATSSTARSCGTCGSAASRIDAAVSQAFLAAMAGDAPAACLAAARELHDGHDSALEQYRRQVVQARYDATKAERRYLAVDAENRLGGAGPGNGVGEGPDRPEHRGGRTGPPRSAETETPDRAATSADPGVGRQPRRGVVRADHHRPGPQGTAPAPCSPRSPSPWTGPPTAPTCAPLEGRRHHRPDGCR